MNEINLYFGTKECIKYFSYKKLRKIDKKRLKSSPNLADKTSFKISRVMIAKRKKHEVFSLSHKDDICLLACGNKKGFGVDLEKIAKRDFTFIVEFCFNKDEKEILLNSKDKLLDFYKIFTAKEAIIKANNLSFCDLAKVGFNASKSNFTDHKNRLVEVFYFYYKSDYLFCLACNLWQK